VYLWLLGVLVVLGILLGKAVELDSTRAERQRELQILLVGDAYRQAIASFVNAPGGDGRDPQAIDELLNDQRFGRPMHHLRRAYPDPETGQSWLPVMDGQQLVGVHSAGTRAPHKQQGFGSQQKDFENAASLGDWHFVYARAATKSP
jgi:hypothetical protein